MKNRAHALLTAALAFVLALVTITQAPVRVDAAYTPGLAILSPLGSQASSTSVSVTQSLSTLLYTADSFPAAGAQVAGSGSHVIQGFNGHNVTGASATLMIFSNQATQPSYTTVPTYQSAAIGSATVVNQNSILYTVTLPAWVAWSSTPGTYTATGSSTGFLRVIGN